MIIFCEDRARPITSKEDESYLNRHEPFFKGVAQPGEFYTFQICMTSDTLEKDVKIILGDLINKHSKKSIVKEAMTCFNTGGRDTHGQWFEKQCEVKGYQVFWIGIAIPEALKQDNYRGQFQVQINNEILEIIKMELEIKGKALTDTGVNEGWRMSRLQWLNSDIGLGEEVTKGYKPVEEQDSIINILGRSVTVGKRNFIDQITSYYSEDLSEIKRRGRNLLRQPIELGIISGETKAESLKKPKDEIVKITESVHEIRRTYVIGDLWVEENLEVEYDGHMVLSIEVQAKEMCKRDDLQLRIPFAKGVGKYAMGLGRDGGKLTPLSYQWNDENQDTIWVGDMQGGLSCKFRDNHYERPFVNVYYNQRKRKKPSWDNQGRGTITLTDNQEGVTVLASTGPIEWKALEKKTFIIECHITPFKTIDFKKHWNTRYFHPHENAEQTEWLQEMEEENCNYLNIHHGQELHPFINYPFVEKETMKSFIEKAHQADKKVKLYYTLRELTNHIDELWPFYSLNNEIFPKNNPEEMSYWKTKNLSELFGEELLSGQRQMWVEENIDENLIPAWQHTFNHGKYKGNMCASILTETDSRLNNFYLEGLDWLIKEQGIDGLYIDDVAYDRNTMQRVRKILDQKDGCLIDLHSWNHRNERAGQVNCALLYMELLPYVDSLWFGEGFDYNKDPDYWLVEMSGIPYGLMGEMLQNDGHPFRGMVYGMTNRSQWGKRQPKEMHKLWDEFEIEKSKMKGYWVSDCPIKVNNEKLRATAYVREEEVLLAVGSWSSKEELLDVDIDWLSLGFKEEEAKAYELGAKEIQEEKLVQLDEVRIPANQGAIILIKKQ